MRISDWSSDVCSSDLPAPGTSAYKTEPGIYSDAQVAGWERVTDAVHAAGGRIALQVFHPGRASHAGMHDGPPPGPSTPRPIRSDERRVGKEVASQVRSPGSPEH